MSCGIFLEVPLQTYLKRANVCLSRKTIQNGFFSTAIHTIRTKVVALQFVRMNTHNTRLQSLRKDGRCEKFCENAKRTTDDNELRKTSTQCRLFFAIDRPRLSGTRFVDIFQLLSGSLRITVDYCRFVKETNKL